MSRPTLRDVAREAGLSVTQVSRALNGHDDVAKATMQHARAVADRMGYVPNREARRLKAPHLRTGTYGLILPDESLRFSDPFFGELLTSMVAEAGAQGREIHLATSGAGADAVAPYRTAVREQRVDGFVLVRTSVDDDRLDFLLDAKIPFVSFGRPPGREGFASVDFDGQGVESAVAHLVELGHRRVACLAEPERYSLGASRRQAFRDAAIKHGLDVSEQDILEAGFHEQAGFEAASRVLGLSEPPTGIIALNDLLALGALEAAASLELGVPSDVSVVGFDDIAAARLVTPALTTLRQSPGVVGRLLLEELDQAVDRAANEERSRLVQSELIIRSSTGPARS